MTEQCAWCGEPCDKRVWSERDLRVIFSDCAVSEPYIEILFFCNEQHRNIYHLGL